MALQIYNVRTRQVEPFSPLDPAGKRVGLYVCGLTVYDHMHIGHGRTYTSFDIIRRWLERAYDVQHIQNVTDVEDKIVGRAKELGISPREHSDRWDQYCMDAMHRLGIRDADDYPHVTRSIPDIIQFIEAIIERGHAYATEDGNVYFDVPGYDGAAKQAFPDCAYGHLSRRDYREMAAGTRKEVAADKRHPADFALWKAAGPEDHPDANWDSPWGRGRPGWHIECSLMATRALGDQIDIHGGGQDLIFPHHENEIAQSQAKTGKAPFVNVWMHTGFLNVEGQKMSKSLGNFLVLNDVLDELEAAGHSPAALRFYFAQTHYRSKIDFSRSGLESAARSVARLDRSRRLLAQIAAGDRPGCADIDPPLQEAVQRFEADFQSAMDDDFNTPEAIAALFSFQKAIHKAMDAGGPDGELGSGAAAQALATLEELGQVLSLFQEPLQQNGHLPEPVVELAASLQIEAGDEAATLDAILQKRDEARAAKDWGTADQVRDALAAAGYVIQDTPQGSRWERA